jgi:hypothetical protein
MQKIKAYKCEDTDHYFTEHVVTSINRHNPYYPGKTELGFEDTDHLVCSVDIEVGDTALVCHAGSEVWFVAVIPEFVWHTPAAAAAATKAASPNSESTTAADPATDPASPKTLSHLLQRLKERSRSPVV